jgi:folate-binding protein YgfZ
LSASGALGIHAQALEAFRILCGIPKIGTDIRERTLPQETGQDRALNFNKGCYIGQEIVERIRARGAVHRVFIGFEVDGTIQPGSTIQSDGKDVGQITSATTIPTQSGERVIALGYLRREQLGADLTAGGVRVRPASVPFTNVLEQV